MNCLTFGSSIARDLMYFDQIRQYEISGTPVTFEYAPFSGKSYEYFIRRPNKIDKGLSGNPDFILVIFGANSISNKLKYKEEKKATATKLPHFL